MSNFSSEYHHSTDRSLLTADLTRCPIPKRRLPFLSIPNGFTIFDFLTLASYFSHFSILFFFVLFPLLLLTYEDGGGVQVGRGEWGWEWTGEKFLPYLCDRRCVPFLFWLSTHYACLVCECVCVCVSIIALSHGLTWFFRRMRPSPLGFWPNCPSIWLGKHGW